MILDMLYKSLWGYKDLFFEHSSISFSSLTDSDTVFGLTRQFEWDNRRSRHLETSGIVVAGVSVQ